ncbi:MAG: hypothetical protein NE327_05410 [Lentisphaeraceae bacterium]|nr:hypothetical protein [Lentisphaeraceae bacterium]
MIKPLTLALALTFTTYVNADTDCKVEVREGELIRLAMHEEADIELIKPEGGVEEKSVKPKDGFKFASVTLKLAGGRSIGLYDYALQPENSNSQYNIVAMSIDGGVYQRRIWEARANGQPKVQWIGTLDTKKEFRKGSQAYGANAVIKLLFEVPSGTSRFNLVSRILDKALLKEYGVKYVLDFNDMSNPTPVTAAAESNE